MALEASSPAALYVGQDGAAAAAGADPLEQLWFQVGCFSNPWCPVVLPVNFTIGTKQSAAVVAAQRVRRSAVK